MKRLRRPAKRRKRGESIKARGRKEKASWSVGRAAVRFSSTAKLLESLLVSKSSARDPSTMFMVVRPEREAATCKRQARSIRRQGCSEGLPDFDRDLVHVAKPGENWTARTCAWTASNSELMVDEGICVFKVAKMCRARSGCSFESSHRHDSLVK